MVFCFQEEMSGIITYVSLQASLLTYMSHSFNFFIHQNVQVTPWITPSHPQRHPSHTIPHKQVLVGMERCLEFNIPLGIYNPKSTERITVFSVAGTEESNDTAFRCCLESVSYVPDVPLGDCFKT